MTEKSTPHDPERVDSEAGASDLGAQAARRRLEAEVAAKEELSSQPPSRGERDGSSASSEGQAARANGEAGDSGPPGGLDRPGGPEAPGGPGAARKSWSWDSWLVIGETLPAWLTWSLGAVPILLLFGLWWWVTQGATVEARILSPTILPSPAEVLASFNTLWFDRALTRNVGISFMRVFEGFAVAVAIAFPLGLLMGSFTKVKAMFNPLSVLGAYMPIPALVPLTLSLLGTGEKQKIGFLALAFVIYLLPLIVSAVESVDSVYLKTAYTLGATKWQVVRKVLLGVSLPEIYQAMRFGFGIGWSYILLAEMVDIGQGVGGLIITSQRRGPREHIYLVLLVIILLAFLTDRVWAYLQSLLFPYKRRER